MKSDSQRLPDYLAHILEAIGRFMDAQVREIVQVLPANRDAP
ncbi:hypothetical protein [Rhodanobacter sp. FW106-PBR-LB-2-19]